MGSTSHHLDFKMRATFLILFALIGTTWALPGAARTTSGDYYDPAPWGRTDGNLGGDPITWSPTDAALAELAKVWAAMKPYEIDVGGDPATWSPSGAARTTSGDYYDPAPWGRTGAARATSGDYY